MGKTVATHLTPVASEWSQFEDVIQVNKLPEVHLLFITLYWSDNRIKMFLASEHRNSRYILKLIWLDLNIRFNLCPKIFHIFYNTSYSG